MPRIIEGFQKSEIAEILMKVILYKEEKGDLKDPPGIIMRHTPKEVIDELLKREVQVGVKTQTYTVEYFSIILGDPENDFRNCRFFLMKRSDHNKDLLLVWETKETDILPWVNPITKDTVYHILERKLEEFKDWEIKKKEMYGDVIL